MKASLIMKINVRGKENFFQCTPYRRSQKKRPDRVYDNWKVKPKATHSGEQPESVNTKLSVCYDNEEVR